MTAREIGGYLELERFRGPMLHEGDIALNCGRACLEYLIELRGINRIWLPDYLCSSVLALCSRCGVEVATYRVGADFLPVYDFEIGLNEWLYLVDYFGQLDAAAVRAAVEVSGGRLVVDESQGYFREPWAGSDTLWTCRKWFGVADGAFLHTRDGACLEHELPRSESFDKMGFVLGRFERPAGEFFAESKVNNSRFASEPMAGMSAITENLLRAVDYAAAAEARRSNWDALDGVLGGMNLLKGIAKPSAPFMYPLFVEDASGIRARLAEERIFIPTLWPNALDEWESSSWAFRYSKNILPLPIDQRYGVMDMERLAKEVSRCLS